MRRFWLISFDHINSFCAKVSVEFVHQRKFMDSHKLLFSTQEAQCTESSDKKTIKCNGIANTEIVKYAHASAMPPWRPKISIFYTPNWTGYLKHIIFWYYISCRANFSVFVNKFKKPNLIHPETHTHKQGKCYIKHQNVMEPTELAACHQKKGVWEVWQLYAARNRKLIWFRVNWSNKCSWRWSIIDLNTEQSIWLKYINCLALWNLPIFFRNEIDEKSLPILFFIIPNSVRLKSGINGNEY